MGRCSFLLVNRRQCPLLPVRPSLSPSKTWASTYTSPLWLISPQTPQKAELTRTLPCTRLNKCTRVTSRLMQFTSKSSLLIASKRPVTTKAKRCKPSLRPSTRSSSVTRTSGAFS
jgi:hypothetical protein